MQPPTWHIIINRTTCGNGWKRWEAFLIQHAIPYVFHHTFTKEESKSVLSSLYAQGHRHYLLMGGDGTIHHGGNALLECSGADAPQLVVGVLPCGTGNDWVRTYGMSDEHLAQALREVHSAPWHIVRLAWPDGRTRYAMNMAGGALDAAVVKGLRRASVKIPSWILYPFGLFKTLLKPHTWHAVVRWDHDSYEGPLLTLQAGFAQYCGGGMWVLPHARQDAPGLLIMKPKSLWKILWQTPDIYNGRIIHQPEAITDHFREIHIHHTGKPIPFEADGEYLGESPVTLTACFNALQRLTFHSGEWCASTRLTHPRATVQQP